MTTVKDLVQRLYKQQRLDHNGRMSLTIEGLTFALRSTVVNGLLRFTVSVTTPKTNPSKVFNVTSSEYEVVQYIHALANEFTSSRIRITQQDVTTLLAAE